DRAEKKPPTQVEKKVPSKLWEDQLKNLRARLTLQVEAAKRGKTSLMPFGADPDLPPWAVVTQTRSASRGSGEPIPHWSDADGQLIHDSGHAIDLLELAVPLRGDFQLDCELTVSAGREIRVAYGGLVLGPRADLKHLERSQLGRTPLDVAINPPLEKAKAG